MTWCWVWVLSEAGGGEQDGRKELTEDLRAELQKRLRAELTAASSTRTKPALHLPATDKPHPHPEHTNQHQHQGGEDGGAGEEGKE
eukprot:3231417-Rhodomonas_salina.2